MKTEDQPKPVTAPAPSAEQAADFAALQASAAGGEPVQGAEQAQEQGHKQPTPQAMQAAGLIVGMILRPVGCALSPGLRAAPDELWGPPVEGFAGLLDHYEIGEKINVGPWMTFVISVAPLFGILLIERMEEKKKKPKDPVQQEGMDLDATKARPSEGPGTNSVSFGKVVEA